jgi:predicted DNA binding CopG/RHH family protein
VQATGEREGEFMKSKRKYSDGPIDEIEVVEDFLPSPEELAFKEDTVKVTISLSRSSVEFFKEEAGKHNTPYQKMIRRLLDTYVDRRAGS